MLILSTFTSDYLQKPLQYLLKDFSSETVDIKYTDTNLPIWLTQLHSSEEKNQTITILFRLVDLADDNKKINESDLKENLSKLVKQIIELKKIKKQSLIVTLCPSPDHFYDKEFKDLENYFLEEMQTNKIHTLSQLDIYQHYAFSDFDNKVEYETRIPYIFEFYVGLACLIARKLHCIKQQPYKVIVVDCDNTLWTGVAGDIGPKNVKIEEHNRDLQKFLVEQKENGVFICLCSKNEEETVNSVFSLKEEMILKRSDVAIKKINRDAKSSNIKAILNELKLANAKNAMFIDDSEREIDEVSQNLPEIFCVLMPQTIDEFNKIWSFDINEYLSITQTDKDRLKLIQQEEALKPYFSQIKDPIESLKAKREKQRLVISKVNKESEAEILARVEQIPKRTNQFNLFPFSENPEKEWNLESLIKSDQIDCFIATIQNKPNSVDKKVGEDEDLIRGDLTALAVCKSYSDYLLVNGFFLSCRNTGLEVEYVLAKQIAIYAESKKLDKIKFKFKKTEVNKLAESFIDILCQETNKYSVVRFLLKNAKKTPSIQSFLFYFFKRIGILPVDFNKAMGKEIIFEFSVNSLIQLDPYLLMRNTIELNAVNNNIANQRLINYKDLGNAKLYLPDLQNEAGNIQYLVEKFMTGCQKTNDLTQMLIDQIKFLMTGQEKSEKIFDIPLDTPLLCLGLKSLELTCLSGSIYKNLGVKVDMNVLLSPETTASVLLEYINQQKGKQIVFDKEPSLAELNPTCLKISAQEERIFSAEQSEGVKSSSRFHMLACFLAYELNSDLFKNAYERMIQFYDVFGFYYSIVDGHLNKSVLPPEKRKIHFYGEKINGEFELMDIIRKKTSEPLAMINSNELIRIFIFENDKKYYILFHIHHCIFDAFSLNLCLETLSKFYNAELKSISLELAKPLSYQNFITYQNDKIYNENYQLEARQFWSQHLSICEGAVEIPSDKEIVLNFKSITELKANRYPFELSQQDSESLNALASKNGVTVYSVIISLFSILVANYTYNERIPITTATSGREALFLDTPGFFVNLLIHAFDLKANKTFCEFIVENHKNLITGIKFQDFSSSEIQKFILHNTSQNVAVVFQSNEIPKLVLKDETAELVVPKSSILDLREHCRFSPLTMFIQEVRGIYTFTFEYAEAKYTEDFIKNIANNFLHLIQNVCGNPNQRLHDISVVCDEEREQLITLGKGPKLNYAEDDNLVKKFQQIVKNSPLNNHALCYGEIRLSYKAVDQQSTNLAHVLIVKGVKSGDFVGIYLEANHLFFIAELAILKIGAVFIPLSKEDPYDRLKSIIEDANIKFFIVDNATKGLFDTDFQARTLIPIHFAECASLDRDLPPLIKTREDRFCILYTSGSTGKPKGVILREKGIFRVVESSGFVKVLPEDKVAQTANQAFDAAQLECWLAWNNGACLVLFDKETILNTDSLQSKLTDEKITHMWLTAGLFNIHANIKSDLFNSLKYLMVGGDVVYKDSIAKILEFEKSPLIINGYGPTETSIFALTYTFHKQTLKNFVTSPIGIPINNTTLKILTSLGGLAPIGAIGELLISGDGVGSYLNLPELEKERFIGNPELRKFLTGDLVKFDSKYHQIMFVGRANKQQIKINGNLVSLEEVRKNLSKHPAIKQAEIIIKKLDGFNQLIAFYILHENATKPTNQEVRNFLKESISSYMIPVFYCQVDIFKTNANGKLDVKWLEEYQLKTNDNNFSKEIVGNEKKLLKVFKAELSYFPNDIEADFFAWGCSSIQAVSLVNKINNTFKEINLRPSDLYENPTVALLTNLIKKPKDNIKKTVLRLLKNGNGSLPAIVFIHPAGGGISCFNKLLEKVTFGNSCYGIEDPFLDNRGLKLLSMEQMARNYYYDITKTLQRPIVIVGFSFGGLLALEIAKLFETQSENNYLFEVVLLDTWVVSCARQTTKDKLIKDVLAHCAKQRDKANVGSSAKIMVDLKKLCEHHQEIGFEFTPEQLNLTYVTLFKATNLDDKFSDMNKQDPDNFVKKFSNEKLFKKIAIPASHFDLLENSDNNSLSQSFSDHIKEITQKIDSKKCSSKSRSNSSMLFYHPLAENNFEPTFSQQRFKQ
ncbi:HAD-IIIC family phosphatase [Rickettsiella endosymbiont of Miltochrista miniata]|uniref:HAD-IIIC family phosphatase n=1 Tax=Rickettsiella endosymbiont of Miltochrista miniata TaxID=3066239 RepID=UPI00313D482B